MGEFVLNGTFDGPGTHAFVVGVSRYPFVDGPKATALGIKSGLSSLTSAARSAAEVAVWLLTEYRNPTAPLKSLHVLLSPADGEVIPDALTLQLSDPIPATRAAFEQDMMQFQARCTERSDNVSFVYVAGHGIQLTNRGAILLLEDYADNTKLNELHGAVDILGCHNAFAAPGYPRRQSWFVDACRERPSFAGQYQQLAGALTMSEKAIEQVDSSPLFLASSSREAAFAEIGEMTLFCKALLWLLRGAGATGPDKECRDWNVPVSRLVELLDRTVKKLAGARGVDQRVDITGRVTEAVIQQLQVTPTVPFRLELTPDQAAAAARASLLFDGRDPVIDGTAEWPIDRVVPAGLYLLNVTAAPPYQAPAGRLISVDPPEFSDFVTVT